MAGVPRVICWFSCGDASAVATALALKKYRAVHEIVVARIVIPEEHEDNDRFADECARWFGQDMVNLRSTEYSGTWDVWEKRRYIAGIAGAPCTANLKKAVRYEFQCPTDSTCSATPRKSTSERSNFARLISNWRWTSR